MPSFWRNTTSPSPPTRIPGADLEVREDDHRQVAPGIVAQDAAGPGVDAFLLEEHDLAVTRDAEPGAVAEVLDPAVSHPPHDLRGQEGRGQTRRAGAAIQHGPHEAVEGG